MRGRPHVAELALLGITAVWGLTFVAVQDAIAIIPTASFLAWRFLSASLLLAAILPARVRGLSRAGLGRGAWMGVFLTAGYLFQTYGLEATTASNAGFITGLFVVITPLLAWLVDRRPIGRLPVAAAIVSTFGLFLLSGAGGSFRLEGDGLELLCAVAFSIHILMTDRAARSGEDLVGLVVVQLAVVGGVSLLIALLTGGLVAPHGRTVWVALVVCSVFASALAFVVQTWAQRVAPPARAAIILAGEPAFSGLFGWWLAGDVLSAVALAGAGLILASIVAVEAVPRLRPPRPLPEG